MCNSYYYDTAFEEMCSLLGAEPFHPCYFEIFWMIFGAVLAGVVIGFIGGLLVRWRAKKVRASKK